MPTSSMLGQEHVQARGEAVSFHAAAGASSAGGCAASGQAVGIETAGVGATVNGASG